VEDSRAVCRSSMKIQDLLVCVPESFFQLFTTHASRLVSLFLHVRPLNSWVSASLQMKIARGLGLV